MLIIKLGSERAFREAKGSPARICIEILETAFPQQTEAATQV